jgi:hypothetical protein
MAAPGCPGCAPDGIAPARPGRCSSASGWAGPATPGPGACAHGFDTDHWTLARITIVIEQATGVGYHPGHTWKLLRRMGWRLQRPARRAKERDEQAIARWVAEDWP